MKRKKYIYSTKSRNDNTHKNERVNTIFTHQLVCHKIPKILCFYWLLFFFYWPKNKNKTQLNAIRNLNRKLIIENYQLHDTS